MATHRGAGALRAGAVAVLVAALLTAVSLLVVLATVAGSAHAQPPTGPPQPPQVTLDPIANLDLRVGGGAQNLNLAIRNTGGAASNVVLEVFLPLESFGVGFLSPATGCEIVNQSRMTCQIGTLTTNQAFTGTAQVGVDPSSPIGTGESRSGNGQAQVQNVPGAGSQSFNVTVSGPEQAPSLREVSGFVTDIATGERISNAVVTLQDGAGVEHQVTANGDGEFRFTPSDGKPIAPGQIGLTATKDGWQATPYVHAVPLAAGDSLTGVKVVVENLNATPSPSATPSSAGPTPSSTASTVPLGSDADEEQAGGGGFFTTLMIVLGLFLVMIGIGAIAFLIWRRRREAQEDDGFDGGGAPTSGPRGPHPTPGSQGVYRPTPTQVVGQGAAATQIIRRPGPGQGLPAVGPNPALAGGSPSPAGGADQTTMLPRATDQAGPPTQIVGAGSPAHPGTHGPRPAGPQPPTYGGATEQPTYGRDQPGYGAAPDRPGYGGAHQSYESGRPAYNGGTGQPYGGRSYGGRASGDQRYGDQGYGGQSSGGQSSGQAYGDQGYGQRYGGPSAGGQSYGDQSSGRPAYQGGYDQPASYGPDPYTQPTSGYGGQPSSGYGQPGPAGADHDRAGYDNGYQDGGYQTDGYHGGGYQSDGYQGGGYQSGGYQGGADNGGYQSGGYQSDGYAAGYGDSAAQPGSGYAGYGQPSAGGYESAPARDSGTDYYDESGNPRSRHSAGPERRRLDWLDD